MARLNLPRGITAVQGLPRTRESLTNCFNVGDKIISRPGVTFFSVGFGASRGVFSYLGYLFNMSGPRMTRIDPDGNFTFDLDTVQGTDQIRIAKGNSMSIVVGS